MTFQAIHSGEEWFQFNWQEFAVFAVVIVIYLLLVFRNKMPSMGAFKEFVDAINTAGGHIFLLSLFSLYFFRTAMRFFFHVLSLPDEEITKHEAIIMTGIGFLTGTAFGGAWGALIKTMSGGRANGVTPHPIVDSTPPAPEPTPDVPVPHVIATGHPQ